MIILPGPNLPSGMKEMPMASNHFLAQHRKAAAMAAAALPFRDDRPVRAASSD
ncbi:hypothetical protein [Azospirillum formosense]|uniref:hypothetical protein n=1 Tax=Azospirillum formosense TaxID=861533 RepID=UPI00157AD181|nr:hypothetical protein [Azospirillum formosense]MBY3753983.1 hypothetical protein [Azospirillum formosense]